jgi:hypothetical protein
MSEVIDFPSLGYVIDDLPENILQELWGHLRDAIDQKNEANHKLAGNISEEYYLNQDNLSEDIYEYLFGLANDYDNRFSYSKYSARTCTDQAGIYSFVIWMQIPYDLTEELTQPHCIKSNSGNASLFNFYFTSHLGKIMTHTINVDKTYEGKIILFPADLSHSVNPFYTSDDYRISIAGNMSLESADFTKD